MDFWQLTRKYALRCCVFQSCFTHPEDVFQISDCHHDPNANQALQDDLNFSAGAGWGKKSRAFSGRWGKGCRCWGLIGTFHCIGDSQSFSLLKIHKDVWFGVLGMLFTCSLVTGNIFWGSWELTRPVTVAVSSGKAVSRVWVVSRVPAEPRQGRSAKCAMGSKGHLVVIHYCLWIYLE